VGTAGFLWERLMVLNDDFLCTIVTIVMTVIGMAITVEPVPVTDPAVVGITAMPAIYGRG